MNTGAKFRISYEPSGWLLEEKRDGRWVWLGGCFGSEIEVVKFMLDLSTPKKYRYFDAVGQDCEPGDQGK